VSVNQRWRLMWQAVALAVLLGLLSACGQTAVAPAGAADDSVRGEPSASTAANVTGPDGGTSDASASASPGASVAGAAAASGGMPTESPVAPSEAPASEEALPSETASASAASPTASNANATPQAGSGAAPGTSVPPKVTPASDAVSPSGPADGNREVARTVTISVVGIGEWGTILPPEEAELKPDDTVSDVLVRVLKSRKLAYETRGKGALLYVAGIDGLFEFDEGPTSGWKYRVNGVVRGEGAGQYKPEPGDRIEWFYTTGDGEAGDALP